MAMAGTGTELDPFLVATPTDMNEIRSNIASHYKQVAHIDLSGFANFIVTSFTGGYDGNGFEIRNLTMTASTGALGLFGTGSGCRLKRIRIVNGNITRTGTTDLATGGLVSKFSRGSNGYITDCHFNGSVSSPSAGLCGGLIGHLYDGTITRCSTSGSVNGTHDVGGLIGYQENGIVEDCFSTANITGLGDTHGGFVGGTTSGSNLRCYSTGSVQANNNAGGFSGYSGTSATIRNCYSLAPFVKRNAGSTGTNFGRFLGIKLASDANYSNNYALSTTEYRT